MTFTTSIIGQTVGPRRWTKASSYAGPATPKNTSNTDTKEDDAPEHRGGPSPPPRMRHIALDLAAEIDLENASRSFPSPFASSMEPRLSSDLWPTRLSAALLQHAGRTQMYRAILVHMALSDAIPRAKHPDLECVSSVSGRSGAQAYRPRDWLPVEPVRDLAHLALEEHLFQIPGASGTLSLELSISCCYNHTTVGKVAQEVSHAK